MKSNYQEFESTTAWYTLKEACDLKNLNYKTACNRKSLQPNGGKEDGHIGGKRVFSRGTIMDWICLTDELVAMEVDYGR